jgi:hypothetical protein
MLRLAALPHRTVRRHLPVRIHVIAGFRTDA